MKRALYVWVWYSMISAGSFGVLIAEDLRLGLPLPYSVPLAFAAMLIVAALLQWLAARVAERRAIVGREAVRESPAPPPEVAIEAPVAAPDRALVPAPPARRSGPATQGLVLLDLSRVRSRRQAA